MKIICINNSYFSKEVTQIANEPVFFIKSENSLSRNKLPFFIPDHSKRIIPKTNVVLKACRLGKNIQEKFAYRYYDEITIGLDMEAADVLENCKKNGSPWEPAKAYDSSAPFGNFISIADLENISDIPFSLFKNGDCIVNARTSEMIFSFDKIISHVSKFVTLKTGDYIFTGSPEINESVEINDKLECYINNKKLLWFNVK
jgi:2-keto-4-pentenoate hydratase/2-oxohepta-3-ene-1,7-dioic acid hydratase in catechol pathway